MSNDLQTTEPGYDDDDMFTAANIFDVERFEQVMRVADIMARATTIPDHLKGKSPDPEERHEETRGNCFMVCNQAANWGMDPFAVAQATSFVYGKICYEGKLIRAVIRKFMKQDLFYHYIGSPGSQDYRIIVSDKEIDAEGLSEGGRVIEGTVSKWATKEKGGAMNGNWGGDPWKMLRERGSREWCRAYRPGLMLGIYAPDEFDELELNAKAARARDITPVKSNPLLDDSSGMGMGTIDKETGEVTVEGKAAAKKTDQTKNSNSAPSSPSRGAEVGGESSSPPRISADTFNSYAGALVRYSSKESVEKAHNFFWEENGGKPNNSSDVSLAKEILTLNTKRAKGEIEVEPMRKQIDEIIRKSFSDL